jgi:hypothetical protein
VQLEKRALASYRPHAAEGEADRDYPGHSNASSISACVTAIRSAKEKANAILRQAHIEQEAIATLNELRSSILKIHPSRIE